MEDDIIYNYGLLCEFTKENFWKKVERKNTTAKELKEKYKKFLSEYPQEIYESVKEWLEAHREEIINFGTDK